MNMDDLAELDLGASTWDLRSFSAVSAFLVVVLSRREDG
ncbi:MAG: hypothetical protein ACI83Y_002875 [Candidatus Azotimanducaceae bacterium]|jgi:hypothetical protein